jgi:membrane-bound lytic murein transglycosylase MltF
LMLAALAFQESGLDHSARSGSGAVGIMQLLPSTAADPNVDVDKIEILENNIHAGTKYLRFLRDRYFSDPEIDDLNQTLLSFAAYNAGPAKIAKLRKETSESGLDSKKWFGNVEHIVAKRVGRETVQYVANIYKYYIAYTLLTQRAEERDAAKINLSESLQ